MTLSRNVGDTDRGFRMAIGIGLIGIVLFGVLSGGLAVLAFVVGVIGLISGLVARCPAYALLSLNTFHGEASGTGFSRPRDRKSDLSAR